MSDTIMVIGQQYEDEGEDGPSWSDLGVYAAYDFYSGEEAPEHIQSRGAEHKAAYENAMLLLGIYTDVEKLVYQQEGDPWEDVNL